MVLVIKVNQKTGKRRLYKYSYGNFDVLKNIMIKSSKKDNYSYVIINKTNGFTIKIYKGKEL